MLCVSTSLCASIVHVSSHDNQMNTHNPSITIYVYGSLPRHCCFLGILYRFNCDINIGTH